MPRHGVLVYLTNNDRLHYAKRCGQEDKIMTILLSGSSPFSRKHINRQENKGLS